MNTFSKLQRNLDRWRIRSRDLQNSFQECRRAELSFLSPLTIFDVGAHDGSSFLPFARLCPRWEIYAFEPTPTLVDGLKLRSKGMTRYHVVPAAVSDKAGRSSFYVASRGDGGCSSLLNFAPERHLHWHGRTDLEVTTEIEVDVIRLDSFIDQNNIDKIDFIHIDTQGNDLAVLRSLGQYLSRRVVRGVIEVPLTPEVRLYTGQPTKEEAVSFLQDAGFVITKCVEQQNEQNLYFQQKSGVRL